MRSLILIPLTLLLSGCWDRDATVPTPGPPPINLPAPGEKPKDPLAQAKADMLASAEKAAQAEARYEVLKKQAADDSLRSQTMWISGICLLLAAVAGVLAFVVPLGKKTLAAAAAGFTAIAACAQAFQWAVPYLPWIGGTLIVGGGVWAAVNWRKLGQTVQTAADYGDRLEDWIKTDVAPQLPPDIQDLLHKTIKSAKEEAGKQAVRVGVHNPLQYLRGKAPSLWQRLTSKIA